jgi:hypothetical protein
VTVVAGHFSKLMENPVQVRVHDEWRDMKMQQVPLAHKEERNRKIGEQRLKEATNLQHQKQAQEVQRQKRTLE